LGFKRAVLESREHKKSENLRTLTSNAEMLEKRVSHL